jgi:hypothetical protein
MSNLRRRTVGLAALALAALLTSQQAFAEWKIKKAEVKWGYPDWTTIHNAEADALENSLDPGRPALAILNEGSESATHRPAAIESHIADAIREYFGIIARAYSAAKFPEPTYLPKNENKDAYLIYLYDFDVSNYDGLVMNYDTEVVGARVTAPCTANDRDHMNRAGTTGLLALNTSYLFPDATHLPIEDREYLFNTLAHELFHTVQNVAEIDAGQNACDSPLAWSEGTASAVGVWMTENHLPDKNFQPYLTRPREPKSTQGWFDFSRDWTEVRRQIGADGANASAPPARNSKGGRYNGYALNPLFRYAMERGGMFESQSRTGLQVAKLFLEGLGEMKGHDSVQDEWWNDRLKKHVLKDPKTKRALIPLALYFPEMLAHHADSWDQRYKVAEQEWVDALFDGCKPITLNRSGTWYKSQKITVKPNAAVCFDVTVKDLKPGQCFEVHLRGSIEAERDNVLGVIGNLNEVVDRLHVSVPALGGNIMRDSKPEKYDCYAQSRSGALIGCSATPMTIETPPDPPEHVQREDGPGIATWSRTWWTAEQKASSATTKNRYILSLVTGDGFSAISSYPATIEFGMRANTELKIEKKPPTLCSGSGTNASMGVGPPHPVTGDPRAILSDLRQGPFFTAMPDVRGLDGIFEEGITVITVTEFGDATPENQMSGQSIFQFGFEEPLRFGAKGKFPAGIGGNRMGSDDGDITFYSNLGDEPSGEVEVVRFDREVLHLKLSGRYCKINRSTEFECKGNYSVSAEMIQPFGWTHDMAQTPRAIFTPGMEPYARQVGAIMGGAGFNPNPGNPFGLPSSSGQAAEPGGNGNPAATGADSSGGSQGCACSCEEFEKLIAMGDEMEDLPEDAMPDLGSFDFGLVQCAMQCAEAYADCEVEEP